MENTWLTWCIHIVQDFWTTSSGLSCMLLVQYVNGATWELVQSWKKKTTMTHQGVMKGNWLCWMGQLAHIFNFSCSCLKCWYFHHFSFISCIFSKELALHIRWPKFWSFSISPSNEYSGLISFRIDWLDLLSVPGTLRSLLQHHSSKASILQHPPFFMVQLSHPYVTTRKTVDLIIWTFVGK